MIILTVIFPALAGSRKLSVVLMDNIGNPITNATVVVKTLKTLGWGHGGDSDYATYSAASDAKGMAIVAFDSVHDDFSWDVVTPMHHSEGFAPRHECFSCDHEEEEAFYDPDSDVSEDVLELVKEVKSMGEVKDYIGYTNLVAKLSSLNVSCSEPEIVRLVSFFPKKNPQPMCSYARCRNCEIDLPMDNFVKVKKDGIEIEDCGTVEYDMKKGKFLPTWGARNGRNAGDTADLKIVRYHTKTNDVGTLFGWVEFAPGCGAYKKKMTGDSSMLTDYDADISATYLNRIPFVYHSVNGKYIEEKPLLGTNEYFVCRTRVMTDDSGSVTNCHYSKIIGPMRVGSRFWFSAIIFNPRPNDNNLEFDMSRNVASEFGGDGGVYCP